MDAIDEGLSSLGESSKQAIYLHIEQYFNVEKKKIPTKIDVFAEAIEKIFGSGANSLETLITRYLNQATCGSLDLKKTKDLTFAEYVAAAKRSFCEERAKQTAEGLTRWEEMVQKG